MIIPPDPTPATDNLSSLQRKASNLILILLAIAYELIPLIQDIITVCLRLRPSRYPDYLEKTPITKPLQSWLIPSQQAASVTIVFHLS